MSLSLPRLPSFLPLSLKSISMSLDEDKKKERLKVSAFLEFSGGNNP